MIRPAPLGVGSVAVTTASSNSVFTLPDFTFNNMAISLSGAITGTAPTMDVYIQALGPDGNYYDMIHFAQVTGTLASPLWAVATVGGQKYVGAAASGTLAASSAAGVGLMGRGIRVLWVAGGTVSTSTLTVNFYGTDVQSA